MPESYEHKQLRGETATILELNGWFVIHDYGDTSMPDIKATRDSEEWLIEVEISGSNVERDLEQGAEIFVTTPDRIKEIEEKVEWKVPVVDIAGFRREVESRS